MLLITGNNFYEKENNQNIYDKNDNLNLIKNYIQTNKDIYLIVLRHLQINNLNILENIIYFLNNLIFNSVEVKIEICENKIIDFILSYLDSENLDISICQDFLIFFSNFFNLNNIDEERSNYIIKCNICNFLNYIKKIISSDDSKLVIKSMICLNNISINLSIHDIFINEIINNNILYELLNFENYMERDDCIKFYILLLKIIKIFIEKNIPIRNILIYRYDIINFIYKVYIDYYDNCNLRNYIFKVILNIALGSKNDIIILLNSPFKNEIVRGVLKNLEIQGKKNSTFCLLTLCIISRCLELKDLHIFKMIYSHELIFGIFEMIKNYKSIENNLIFEFILNIFENLFIFSKIIRDQMLNCNILDKNDKEEFSKYNQFDIIEDLNNFGGFDKFELLKEIIKNLNINEQN